MRSGKIQPIRLFLIAAIFISLVLAYSARDYLVGRLAANTLHQQSQQAIGQESAMSSLRLHSSGGQISIRGLSLTSSGDVRRRESFSAERVDLDVEVTGILSPHVLVRHARVHDAELLLEYVAPGVSNLKMIEQSYRAFAQQREREGRSSLLEWDLQHVELYQVRFKLIDYDGAQLADVTIPRIALGSLGTSRTPEDNVGLFMHQVQLSVIEEIVKGRVQGEYDMPGLLRLVRRELPNSRLITAEPIERAKEAGRSLLERWLK